MSQNFSLNVNDKDYDVDDALAGSGQCLGCR
jgi:hypothetical protein